MTGFRINALRRIVDRGQAEKLDGYLMDIFTASMLITVHDALSPANQIKFEKIPLPKLVDFGWSHVK